ncbi:hypothetical protein ACOME3_007433 [Neoechinorhynchus agilis]
MRHNYEFLLILTSSLYNVLAQDCSKNPCENRGTCISNKGGYQCNCKPEYTGADCNDDVNECSRNPCPKDVHCINTFGAFRCDCPSGLAGAVCEDDVDECKEFKCPFKKRRSENYSEYVKADKATKGEFDFISGIPQQKHHLKKFFKSDYDDDIEPQNQCEFKTGNKCIFFARATNTERSNIDNVCAAHWYKSRPYLAQNEDDVQLLYKGLDRLFTYLAGWMYYIDFERGPCLAFIQQIPDGESGSFGTHKMFSSESRNIFL